MKVIFAAICVFIFQDLHAQEPRLVIPAGKPDRSLTLALSPDTKRAAAYDRSNLISIWDAEKGFFLSDIYSPSATTAVVNVSNAPEIVIASEDSVVRIVDIRSGQTTRSWKINMIPYRMLLSVDGNTILLQNAGSVMLLHRQSDAPVFLYETDFIFGSALSHNGKYFSIIKEDTAFVHLTSDASLVTVIPGTYSMTSVENPVFSPDDKRLYTANYNGGNVWNLYSGEFVSETGQHEQTINYAVFSPDGKLIATCSDDSTVKLWNVANGKLVHTFRGHKGEVNHADFNYNGTRLLTTALDKTAKNQREVMVWNVTARKKEFSIPLGRLPVNTARFSSDGNRIIIDFLHTEPPRIVEANSGEIITRFQPLVAPVSDVAFNRSGDRILSLSGDKVAREWDMSQTRVTVTDTRNYYRQVYTGFYSPDFKKVIVPMGLTGIAVWDTTTRKKLFTLDSAAYVSWGQFSPDGKQILTTSVLNDEGNLFGDLRPKLWNGENGDYSFALTGHRSAVFKGIFNASGSLIATAGGDSTVRIWGAAAGKELHSFLHNDKVTEVAFSDDNQYLVSGTEKGILTAWHIPTGKPSVTIPTGEALKSVRISPDHTRLLTLSGSNAMKIWDRTTGKELYQFFGIGQNDHFIKSKGLYYLATPEAAKKLYYVNDSLEVITFEQLDIKYNRPDLILKAVGSPDTALISGYHKAWQKRMKKLGVDTAAFDAGFELPEAKIMNRDTIAYNRTSSNLRIRISATDKNHALARFNFWVNESPLFGNKGISISRNKEKSYDTTITIPLSAGVNMIETSVINSNGAESYRIPLYVRYQPKVAPKEKLYFVGIGIDRFAAPGHDLGYSVKDIKDLAARLKKKYKLNIIIDTLFNEKVTAENVMALKAKLRKTTIHDKVILAYSGHGLLSADFDYYLSTYPVNFQKPEINGLPYDALENLLDAIPARKKLMLIDACHSGEVDKETMNDYVQVLTDSSRTGLKGAIVENKDSSKIGIKNSFELMQELFANVSRTTGATIISAAAGTQLAQERGDLKNGVFTFSILEFMEKQPTATVTQLKNYVNKRVPDLTNGLQVPTTRTETKAVDWRVW